MLAFSHLYLFFLSFLCRQYLFPFSFSFSPFAVLVYMHGYHIHRVLLSTVFCSLFTAILLSAFSTYMSTCLCFWQRSSKFRERERFFQNFFQNLSRFSFTFCNVLLIPCLVHHCFGIVYCFLCKQTINCFQIRQKTHALIFNSNELLTLAKTK
uniref:Uncharacterized protein n=1 Tax=Cacopsylla melanoneura TaxID=428564 RepID=A0A8D9E6Y3_9HEMI